MARKDKDKAPADQIDWMAAKGKPFAVTLVDRAGKVVQTVKFDAGEPLKEDIGGDQVYVTCEFQFANGESALGIVQLGNTADMAGLHFDSGFCNPTTGKVVYQTHKNFLRVMGMKREDIFPYKYKPIGQLDFQDPYLDENGWSAWEEVMQDIERRRGQDFAGLTQGVFELAEGQTWQDQERADFG